MTPRRASVIAGLVLSPATLALAQNPATPAVPAIPATPAVPGGPGAPATPAVPATPAIPAVPPSLDAATDAAPAVHGHARATAIGPNVGGSGGSAPTCGDSTPNALTAAWGCVALPDTSNYLQVDWSADNLTCVPTKYAVEVKGKYTDLTLDPPAECTVEVTSKFTALDAATAISIPWDDIQDLPLVFCSDIPVDVKVKALTTTRGGSNRSQNNAFATTTATGDATEDACVP